MEEILKKVSDNILTTQDLSVLLDEINVAGKFLFQKVEIPLSEKIRGKVSHEFFNLVKELENENIFSQNPEKDKEFLEILKEYLLKIPQLKIELAFEPDREFLKELTNFFEKFFHQKIILDILINPKIVAGIIFEFKGKIFDFSLAKEIERRISE